VALSGGVDSSVAAALLVRQGHYVSGAYMKQWSDTKEVSGVCTWKEDRRDAMRVAAKLGIDFLTLDFEKEYKEWVMGYMFDAYQAGRTPNPDVMCNKFIKFGAWLDKAHELGFDYLATGHYARLRRETQNNTKLKIQNNDQLPITNYQLLQAKDENKDQTYFLHQLSQEQLAHTMFPLGEYTKADVRKMAHEFDLPTANRPESMGICFVGEVPMKDFLQQKIHKTPGKIVMSSGEGVGEHEGLAFYTIGQRHLGVHSSKPIVHSDGRKPLYVVEKDFEKNELVVGYEDDPLLYKKQIGVQNMHWIGGSADASLCSALADKQIGASGHSRFFQLECEVRLRHRQPLQKVMVRYPKERSDEESLHVMVFDSPQRAVTPGQFAVMYKDGVCLGGGIIEYVYDTSCKQ